MLETPGPGLATLLAHDDAAHRPFGAVVPPIFQNSLFTFESSEKLTDQLHGREGDGSHVYSRFSNPTLQVVEEKISRMQGLEATRLVGCGMAAITTTILAHVKSGSHVVTLDTIYPPVKHILNGYLGRFGVTATFLSGTNADEMIDAIRPETTLVLLESPSSFVFKMQDVARIALAAREKGVVTAIDNTYNTPIHFQPASVGVDIVCESATKYMGGHSDLTAGSISGSEEAIKRISREEVNLLGNILHPQAAWLLLRGLRTLPLRMARHQITANAVAGWLEDRPEVRVVHHVGLDSHPQRALVCASLKGTGGLFSFEPVQQDKASVMAFCDALQIFARGISWGGHESLVLPLWTTPNAGEAPRWLVRIFCGLEDTADLIGDLESAMLHLA